MDAFYASVEQRDDPALRGRPVAVGGAGPRGVVMAASYEARVFGVRSAMPGFQARRLCPELIFVRTRFDAYQAASRQIRAIFSTYTDLVEPLSLDEAYLDVTAPRRGPPSATVIARRIKQEIRQATGLTASAGVSFNKFLAKVASAMDKPDGLFVIRPEDARAFVAGLPFNPVMTLIEAEGQVVALYHQNELHQVAPGNENGLRLRVYGATGGLEWAQEDPNYLWHTPLGEPKRLLTRGGAGTRPDAARVTRVPAGHPEGYLEGFANIYAEAARAILARRAGRPVPEDVIYPTIEDGVAGVAFVDACVRSSARNGAWIRL